MLRQQSEAAVALKQRGHDLLAASQYDQLVAECTARIDNGEQPLYLAYLFRASALLMAGEVAGAGLMADVRQGIELAGDAPEQSADALYMALAVYLHVGSGPLFDDTAERLLTLAKENPEGAERYIPGVYQFQGFHALSQQDWSKALALFDRAVASAHLSPRAELERAMAEANRATALLPLGRRGEADEALSRVRDSGVGFGCLLFEVDCLQAMSDALSMCAPTLPAKTAMRPAARMYWLLACATLKVCGFVSPEANPLDDLKALIRETKTFAYCGLRSWVESL